MPSATVRITPKGHAILSQLAGQAKSAMPEILEDALECYRRQKFLESADAAYESMQKDSRTWQNYRRELESLDATLSDGLED